MKKIAIINRGIPATGKSTFAQEIAKTLAKHNFSCEICSTNDFFMQNGKFVFEQEKLGENHKKNQEKFKQALEKGIDVVICDNVNTEPWEANTYYHLAKMNDYKVILIDFEPNSLEWHIKAQSNPNYNRGVPSNILEDMYKRYLEFKELTDKYSHPSHKLKKKIYNEKTKKTERIDEASEPFYYDHLIKVSQKEKDVIKETIGQAILKKMRDFSLEELKLIPKEYKIIIEEFYKRPNNTLTAYDLKSRLAKSPKQIERYIQDLQMEFSNIIKLKNKINRKTAYKLILDYDDILIEAIKSNDEFYDLLDMLDKEHNKAELLKKLKTKLPYNESPLLFKNNIFERIQNREIFNKLKQAIKENRYQSILINDKVLNDIKPIKLIFIDNNWYLAYEDNDTLQLSRLAFIKKIKHSYKNKFQKSTIQKYLEFLSDENKFQNSMTLYGKKQKTARIKALPQIAKYFEKEMKSFLPSQTFIKKEEDGSIIFTLKYTQPLEILPFIQKWMPDLIILEPQELKDEYIKKLNLAIKQMSKNHN